MFGIINSMNSPEMLTNAFTYDELIQKIETEFQLSNITRVSVKRGMSDIVRGVDFQKGAEIIYVSEGVTGEELLEALEIEDGSEATFKLTDSYYGNKLVKENQYEVFFGDQLKVMSEDKSEATIYVLMEDSSSKSTCTDIAVKEFSKFVKEIDNLNRVITVVEPVEGLVASELLAELTSTDGSHQIYDVQGIEPVFDDALITKANNFDLATEAEELVVISENKHNVAKFRIEISK